MLQASRHMAWCLDKAKKEIEECRRVGKKEKHRGLLSISPDLEKARNHIVKAEHDLRGITAFKEIGFSDWSMSAGFYSLYHCFLAIAAACGYESRNQTCTVALMKYLKETNKIQLDEKYIKLLEYEEIEDFPNESIIDLRENYTYGVNITITDEARLDALKKLCKELLDVTKQIVYK